MPNPKRWENFPTFRIDERIIQSARVEKPRISAIFRVWHTSCKVFGIPGMAPRKHKDHSLRRPKMFATDLSNRFAAAAFSLVITAAMMAYAIVPATPSLA
jgi:hypothetical protein